MENLIKAALILITLHLLGINFAFADSQGEGVPSIRIYNAYLNPTVPLISKGFISMVDGKKRGIMPATRAVRAANESLALVSGYFFKNLGLYSYDGKGTTIEASVNVQKVRILDFFGLKQNAAWFGQKTMFIFGGGGNMLDNFERSIDVVAHEYTHAIIDNSTQLAPEGQPGALNEHLADVFGVIIENQLGRAAAGSEFLIGDTVLSQELKQKVEQAEKRTVTALRDMLNPENGLDRQPRHMSAIPAELGVGCKASASNDACGVHILSGIPNRAAALILQKVGMQRSQQLFFNVATLRLTSQSSFADYAALLRKECGQLLNAVECQIVDNSLISVGL